jgi:predicted acylesterase/phospholipase RssA
MTLGALQYAYDNALLNKVHNYVGTSAGAIVCFLLIIGYTPVEIIAYICTNQILEKMKHLDIVAMMRGNGAMSFSHIYEQLEKMTIEKIGFLPTFENINSRFGKHLACVTYNLTNNATEYVSVDTHPNLPCIIALKMSANLPLIFEPFKYRDMLYIDGGISNNFAIDYGDRMGKKTLGIMIDDTIGNKINNFYSTDTSILEYIYRLIFIPIMNEISIRVAGVSPNCDVIRLNGKHKMKFFTFNISTKVKLNIFSSGYHIAKTHFEMRGTSQHTNEILLPDVEQPSNGVALGEDTGDELLNQNETLSPKHLPMEQDEQTLIVTSL